MPSFIPRFRLVTFDVTNTLLKFRTSAGDQYSKAAKLFGVESDPTKIDAAFRNQWKLMWNKYPNFGKNAGLSSREWWTKIIDSSFLNADCKLTNVELTAISTYLYEIYATEQCWDVAHGVQQQLELLQQHNVTIGAISNFDERLESVLRRTGLRSYFQFIVASYLVSHEKPSKQIFDIALSKYGGIASHDAIHVGDNYELDYLAAKQAGWNALLLLPHTSEKRKDISHCKIDMISHVQDVCNFILKPAS